MNIDINFKSPQINRIQFEVLWDSSNPDYSGDTKHFSKHANCGFEAFAHIKWMLARSFNCGAQIDHEYCGSLRVHHFVFVYECLCVCWLAVFSVWISRQCCFNRCEFWWGYHCWNLACDRSGASFHFGTIFKPFSYLGSTAWWSWERQQGHLWLQSRICIELGWIPGPQSQSFSSMLDKPWYSCFIFVSTWFRRRLVV